MNRILIVGEYSGVGKNIANALQSLGCYVKHLSDGDSFKKITNSRFDNKHLNFMDFLISTSIIKLDEKYDLTIFLSPFVFKMLKISKFCNDFICMHSKKTVLINCTSDAVWWNYWDEINDRSPHFGYLRDLDFKPHRYANQQYLDYNIEFAKNVDTVITLAPDYTIPYQRADIHVIESFFPMEKPEELTVNSEGNVFHGITRPGFKGSIYIENYLRKSFPEDKIKITKKTSFNDFLQELFKADMYFDQVFSQTPAMAALTALYCCPIVVTGVNRKLTSEYVNDCPAFDFKTQQADLVSLLNMTPKMRSQYLDENHHFLYKYHDNIKIAEEILNG